jgi:hypothetical protein
MTNQKLIHIKLSSEESFKTKKDILSSERDLLSVAKTIKKYQSLRSEELKLKLKIHRRVKELLTNLKSLQKILPQIEVPEILSEMHEAPEEIEKRIKKAKEIKVDVELETQLKNIQEKLKEMGN